MYPVLLGSPFVVTSAQNASAGQTVYLGAFTGGANNAFVGMQAFITGFSSNDGVNNTPQNGYLVTNSSAVAITLQNPNGISEGGANAYLYLFAVNADGPYGGGGPLGNSPFTSNNAGQGVVPGPDVGTGGKSLTARNFFNSWNYSHSDMSTQNLVAALTAARNSGSGWSVVSGFQPSAPAQVSQGTPSAPSGTFSQQGSPALTNVSSVTLSGFSPGQCSFVQFSGAYQSK